MAHDDHVVLSPGGSRGDRRSAIGNRNHGFTLIELVVALVIGVLLAAAVVPALIGRLEGTRVDETADSLDGIAEAVGNMFDDVGRYPGLLSQLTTAVASGDSDVCGVTYGVTSTSWAGPYLNRSVPTTGLPLPIGTAQNTLTELVEVPASYLAVVIDDVDWAHARALNLEIDADADSAAGAVRWSPVVDGAVDLTYVRPIKDC